MKTHASIALCLCLLAACSDDDGSQQTTDGGHDVGDAAQSSADAATDASAPIKKHDAAAHDAALDAMAMHDDDSGSKPGVDANTSGDVDAGSRTVPTFVAVGYAGVRIVSYDLGLTWEHRATLGTQDTDDATLLRTVTYGDGLFVAAGHKVLTSPDGVSWTERVHPQTNAQWIGGLRYGNGRFVGAGGFGYSVYSDDGLEWMMGDARGTEAARTVAFGDGMFIAGTDPGNWWKTSDGETWTLDSGGHDRNVSFCDGAFKDRSECGDHVCGAGVCLRIGGWNTKVIKRSTDGGATFKDVQMPEPASLVEIGFGYTEP